MRAIPSLLLLALLSALPAYAHAQTSLLDRIQERGEIRIGTTGDYKPFTYLNPETGTYEGMDIEAAHLLGETLGVSVRFVPTTWSTLSDDTMGDRFDLAMSGITRTLDRQKILALTNPYVTIGKSALIRKSDRNRFRGLQDMDRPWVRIGVNRGGTNEAFVRANIRQAAIVMFENNLDVQPAVAAGDVDVMFTDNVEAVIYARQNPVLYALSPGEPLTREDIGYMTVRGDQPFVNFLNLWLFQMEQKGTLDALRSKWIGEY
ncbi:MAG: transporter substrate-binding domain-containing protein [Gemmatimonadota bacterium]|nr:transporter substrate-binding domain-containing protein [Gemmatimonadota bacterium]